MRESCGLENNFISSRLHIHIETCDTVGGGAGGRAGRGVVVTVT